MTAPKGSEAVLLDKSATVAFLYRLSKLKLWPDNYHKGDIDLIVRSIKEFGFNGALRIWKGDEVRGGNHAKLALEQMKTAGLAAPRGIEVDGDEWLVLGIDISHLDEAEAVAYAIADNETAKAGSNNDEKLAHLLSTVKLQNTALLKSVGVSYQRMTYLMGTLQSTSSSPKDMLDKVKRTKQSDTVSAAPTAPKTNNLRTKTSLAQLVLTYDDKTHKQLTADMTAIREYYGVDSDADALLKLVEAHKRDVG